MEGALHMHKGMTGLWGQSLTGPNSSFQEPNLKKQNSRGSLCVSPLCGHRCVPTHILTFEEGKILPKLSSVAVKQT